MSSDKTNSKYFKIGLDEKPSRFVVNLKKTNREEDFIKTESGKTIFRSFRDGLFEFILQKKHHSIFKKIFQEIRQWPAEKRELLIQLTLFNILKNSWHIIKKVGVFFNKFCFRVGWILVFSARLVYLISLSFLNIVAPFIKNFYSIFKRGIEEMNNNKGEIKQKFLNILPKPDLKYTKSAIVFALILFVLILPFKSYTYYKSLGTLRGKILGISEAAVNDLLMAGESASGLDFEKASGDFSKAADNFLLAQKQLNEINNLVLALTAFSPQENLRLASVSKNILETGQLSAELGHNLSLALSGLLNNQDKNLGVRLNDFNFFGHQALSRALEITNILDQIDNKILPEQYREQFDLLRKKATILAKSLGEFINLTDELDEFLGINIDKRYLLVFQNNAELRASGGFIGSFALVDFKNGEIKNIEVPGGGSYDTEAGLAVKIAAPEPLHLVNPLWHFWDANWWPDWPMSAKKLMWFYEKSDGPTVDGVISFTPTVIEKLLKIIGPVDMSDNYGVIIDADNFWLVTQTFAEQKPDVTKEPKKIIGDLMAKLLEEFPHKLNQENFVPLLKIVEESLAGKHILFYFSDPGLQEKISGLGWDGRIKQTNGDYLMVVNTNIAGGKSDRKIEEIIEHQAEIMPNGSIVDTVIIKRAHTGIKREPFCGVRNVDWMRIYVPEGSELIEAHGFKQVDQIYFEEPNAEWQKDPEILKAEANLKIEEKSNTKVYNELGKTVFANWSQVDPGQTVEIYLKYKLPFTLNSSEKNRLTAESTNQKTINKIISILNPIQKKLYPYSLLIQKQPGAMPSEIKTGLVINEGLETVWKYPKEIEIKTNGWLMADYLNADKFWAVLLTDK